MVEKEKTTTSRRYSVTSRNLMFMSGRFLGLRYSRDNFEAAAD